MCLKSTEMITSQICETFSWLIQARVRQWMQISKQICSESLAIHLFLSPLKLTHLKTNPKSCKELYHRHWVRVFLFKNSTSLRQKALLKETKGRSSTLPFHSHQYSEGIPMTFKKLRAKTTGVSEGILHKK